MPLGKATGLDEISVIIFKHSCDHMIGSLTYTINTSFHYGSCLISMDNCQANISL